MRPVRTQELDRGRQLRPAGLGADAAIERGGGALTGAAERYQEQAGLAAAQRRGELVGVALPRPDVGTRRVRLHALRQGSTERQVVADRRTAMVRTRGPRPGGTAGGENGQAARYREHRQDAV